MSNVRNVNYFVAFVRFPAVVLGPSVQLLEELVTLFVGYVLISYQYFYHFLE
jgi:hypothetical protein